MSASLITLVLTFGAATADANPNCKVVVIESTVGRPIGYASQAIDPLTYEIEVQFEAEGFAAMAGSIDGMIGGRLPRPGVMTRTVSASQVLGPLDNGYSEWADAKFSKAEFDLAEGLRLYWKNPALFATDSKNLDQLFRAMGAYAHSEIRLGKTTAAYDALVDLKRTFRNRPISTDVWPPDLVREYDKVTKQLGAQSHGQVSVEVDDPHVMIFINGEMRGVGSASLADLVPGIYHVFMQTSSQADLGRRYEIEVHGGDKATLKVKWEIDSAFWSDTWLGLTFSNETEHANIAAYAAEVASWTSNSKVVVVERFMMHGKQAVIATMYDNNGKQLHSNTASLAVDRSTALRDLARRMCDGTNDDPRTAVAAPTPPAPSSSPTPATPHEDDRTAPSRLGLMVGGAAAAVMAASGIFYAVSPADDQTLPTYKDHRTPAVITCEGGSAVLGLGVYLWLREAHSADTLTAAVLGTGVAAISTGAMLYIANEDPSPIGHQRPTYRDTATPGLIVGAVGLALVGTGAWLLHRESSDSGSAPVVSLDRNGGFVGWAGGF